MSRRYPPSMRRRPGTARRWLNCLRVDLGPEEVVDARAVRTRAVERRVDRVLVRPRRSHASVVDHLEDRVDSQEVPRLNRLAGRRIDRICRRVEARLRVWTQVQDQARVSVIAARIDRAALVERGEGIAAPVINRSGTEGRLSSGES